MADKLSAISMINYDIAKQIESSQTAAILTTDLSAAFDLYLGAAAVVHEVVGFVIYDFIKI